MNGKEQWVKQTNYRKLAQAGLTLILNFKATKGSWFDLDLELNNFIKDTHERPLNERRYSR